MGQMRSEFGLFVVWSAVSHLVDPVLAALASRFEIRGVHKVIWSTDRVAENFGRFYRSSRLTRPYHTYFQHQKGSGPFTVITVLDRSPTYGHRPTNKGTRLVNTNFFDAKVAFRSMTPLPKVIHGTETAEEGRRDILMLLGVTPEQYLAHHGAQWCGEIDTVRRDVTGASGWNSLGDVFEVLNQLVQYIVMRNFEGLPDSHIVGSHDDVDLLVDDYHEAIRVLNARPLLGLVPVNGGRFCVDVGNEPVIFDLRHVGDGYFDTTWQREVLERRELSAGGLYVPCPADYFETLAYHAVIHKSAMSLDYAQRLAGIASEAGVDGWTLERLMGGQGSRQLIDSILLKKGRRHVKPRDVTVYYNYAAAGATMPWARRKLAGVTRRAHVYWYRAAAPVVHGIRTIRYELVNRIPALRRLRRPPAMN
jgi:hypothetical protein